MCNGLQKTGHEPRFFLLEDIMKNIFAMMMLLASIAWTLECPEWSWHTHYVEMGYCVTYNGQTYINDVSIAPNGNTPPTHEGWQACAEIGESCVPVDSIDRIDTLYLTDTLYIHDTTYVPDTTIAPVIIYDTTITPVTVFDTTVVPVVLYDTTVTPVELFDTTITAVELFDTTITPVVLYDTTRVPVTLYDTTRVPVAVYDTTNMAVVLYDTTIVPVSLFDTTITYDTTITEVTLRDTIWAYDTLWTEILDTIITEVDSFYNVGVERPVLDTFLVIGIDQFTTEYRFDHGLSGSPILVVGVDVSDIGEDEELKVVVDVKIYDQIGQFVDQMKETRVVDHSGGDIEIFEEFVIAKETERGLETEDGKKYGTGAYILRGFVQVLVDDRKIGTVAEQRLFGHRR